MEPDHARGLKNQLSFKALAINLSPCRESPKTGRGAKSQSTQKAIKIAVTTIANKIIEAAATATATSTTPEIKVDVATVIPKIRLKKSLRVNVKNLGPLLRLEKFEFSLLTRQERCELAPLRTNQYPWDGISRAPHLCDARRT